MQNNKSAWPATQLVQYDCKFAHNLGSILTWSRASIQFVFSEQDTVQTHVCFAQEHINISKNKNKSLKEIITWHLRFARRSRGVRSPTSRLIELRRQITACLRELRIGWNDFTRQPGDNLEENKNIRDNPSCLRNVTGSHRTVASTTCD